MINTLFRLVILVPAALLCGVASFASLKNDAGFLPGLVAAAIAAVAVALIAWTIRDHRKRARAKVGLNA
jgi:hypothetical protein